MTGGNKEAEKAWGHGYEEKGVEKPSRTWKRWKHRSQTSKANSTRPLKSVWQKSTTSTNSIRKKKKSNKPTIKPNRESTKSGVCGGEKEFSIVGLMQEGKGANATNSD